MKSLLWLSLSLILSCFVRGYNLEGACATHLQSVIDAANTFPDWVVIRVLSRSKPAILDNSNSNNYGRTFPWVTGDG